MHKLSGQHAALTFMWLVQAKYYTAADVVMFAIEPLATMLLVANTDCCHVAIIIGCCQYLAFRCCSQVTDLCCGACLLMQATIWISALDCC